MFKVKVLVVGPCQVKTKGKGDATKVRVYDKLITSQYYGQRTGICSGKTTVSNFLADATDQASGEYHPTQGCRIVEFECNTGGRQNVEVEMWDCSGDRRFETCWPAMAKDTNGIVFVFNPDMPNHDKDMEGWYDYFVAQQNLKDSQCIAFAHHKPGANERERSQLSDTFTKVQTVPTNIEDDGDDVRNHFNNYLSRIISALSDNREKEELSIMNN